MPGYGDVNNAFVQKTTPWQGLVTAGNCDGDGKGKGLQAWPLNSTPGGNGAGWWFQTPSGTSITALSEEGQYWGTGGWVAHCATSVGGRGDPLDEGCMSGPPGAECAVFGPDPQSSAVNHAHEIGVGIWCDTVKCPANGGPLGPAASINLGRAVVTIDEPGPPSFTQLRGNLASAAGWISANAPGSTLSLAYAALDPAGVCDLQATITNAAGTPVLSSPNNIAPDYTQPAPCGTPSRSATWTPNIAALPNGSYHLQVQASNPANMTSQATGGGGIPLEVDNTPPTIGVASAPDPGRWYSSPQSVTWTCSDSVSGVQALNCIDSSSSHAGSSYTMTVAQQGSTSVNCSAVDGAGNVSSDAGTTVNIDAQTPSVSFAGASESAWLRGPQTVTVSGAEQSELSGVAGLSCSLDGGGAVWTAGSQATVTATVDGVHEVQCRSETNAGVWSAVQSYAVHVDSTPPSVSFAGGLSQGRWYGSPQSIRVDAHGASGLAPVQLISCTLGGQTTTYPGAQAQITVAPPGGSLVCQAEDEAGTWSQSQAWQFLESTTPPSGYFAPLNPARMTQVVVPVADPGPGVAGGEIDIQVGGGWVKLPTTYGQAAGQLVGRIPDDGSIPDGVHPLRALVWDAIGNRATITTDQLGDRETVSLPLRIVTQLRVARSAVLSRRCTLARVAPRARRRGRRVVGQRARARLVWRCRTVVTPRASGPLTLSYRQAGVVHGLMVSADREPIAGARIGVSARPWGWRTRPAGTVTTDRKGEFMYRVKPGPSRALTFTYAGSGTIRPSSAHLRVGVRGACRLRISRRRVRVEQWFTLSGRVRGGYIPAGGLEVLPQVSAGSETFGLFGHPVYTGRRGRWHLRVRLPVAGIPYTFRFVIRRQTRWPWRGAMTRSITVTAHA